MAIFENRTSNKESNSTTLGLILGILEETRRTEGELIALISVYDSILRSSK